MRRRTLAARLALMAVLLLQLAPAVPSSAQTRRAAPKQAAAEAPEATPTPTPTPSPTPKPAAIRRILPRVVGGAAGASRQTVEAPAATPVNTNKRTQRAPTLTRAPRPKLPAPPEPQTPQFGTLPSESVTVESVTTVDFRELSRMAAASRQAAQDAAGQRVIHSPGAKAEPDTLAPASNGEAPSQGVAPLDDPGQPNVPSPGPSQSFLAQEDGPRVGGTSFVIPPDTTGAVGLNKVFTQTNSNFRIHDKLTGAALDTMGAETFWSSTGASGVFDPRVVFDPYQQRWITAIVSNSNSASSSVLVGVSNTADPQGTYQLFRITVGFATGSATPFANGGWADFPMLGFNKNWVAIGYNMHANTNNAFIRAEVLVLSYPGLRAGTVAGSRVNAGASNFCLHPATTFSATEEALYIVEHLSSAGATLAVARVTGTPSAPAVALFGPFTRPGGGWVQPIGDLLPQDCIPGSPVATFQCPASPRKFETSDAQIRGNVVFRNGKVWYSQTVGIDLAGGDPIDHTAAQWTVFTPTAPTPTTMAVTFNDGGRVEDTTATATNGGKWYAYTSIAVNRNEEVILGFSEFESDDFADAAYAFRDPTDAAGTMRDPVVFKEGEDYYEKTFSGARNRFGDYSHAVVDPVNDADLWTIQEYTQPRVVAVPPDTNNPLDGLGANSSRWSTWWAKLTLAAPGAEGDLVISEFRTRGPGGAEDEYFEIHNRTGGAITVTTTDGSAGYALAASDGIIRHTIPNGTVIPARGHYLIANSDGYSLTTHPAGNATTATPDGAYTDNIPDNGTGEGGLARGVALFNTANTANFSLANRLDAVGPTAETNALYREGTGLAPLTPDSNTQHAWVRDPCGKQGSISTFGTCPSGGAVVDTDDNTTDFFFVDVDGFQLGAGQRLGAPGPENLTSPIQRNSGIGGTNLDPAVGSNSPPNRVRDFTSTPAQNSTFGTLLFRKTIINNTGAPITRLRFRIIDISTFPTSPGNADLRVRSSSLEVVAITGPNAACPANTCTVQATTLEEPPAQANGGGINSTLSAGTVALATPVANGQGINVQFLLGIQQTGRYKFYINVEVLP